jgi:hypothetical protein
MYVRMYGICIVCMQLLQSVLHVNMEDVLLFPQDNGSTPLG